MCISLDLNILPKTLLKWATPHYKRATKFKTKNFNKSNLANQRYPKNITKSLPLTRRVSHAISFEKSRSCLISFLSLVVSLFFSLSFSFSLTLSLSLSLSYTRLIAQFFYRTVIQKLTFLMNDFRFKSLYQTSKTAILNNNNNKIKLITSSIFSTLSTLSTLSSAVIIGSKLFSQNYKNNHRTYNNSSKSNKVFLYYTPRDPRLRFFNRQTLINKHFLATVITFKCDSVRSDNSQLKITEDLSNYGELIGGFNFSSPTINTLNNCNFNNYISNKSDNIVDKSKSEYNCDCVTTDVKSIDGDNSNLKSLKSIYDIWQNQLSCVEKYISSYVHSKGFHILSTGLII
ncbi:uncharacterized protein LOC119677851 [Teleopsis dalmanni]|uniref:uncharacterized protein LOC119677851 n=1 Tax=Teleopsis dalmanni TaxID=139649 RepID=UPI0018CE1495|nr:uncharacterized protein LOC119677851 [Teleopsis dalmanni]XP_037945336.1 uncharacterized protein LOC119677851 [Teleopsis dalmanni]